MTIKQAFEEIRRLSIQLTTDGATQSQIDEGIREFIRKNKLSQKLSEQAARQAGWTGVRTMPLEDRRAAVEILTISGNEYATLGGKISESVANAVTIGLNKGETIAEIQSRIAKALKGKEYYARSIANTAVSAFDQASIFKDAREADIDKFRFTGPPPERQYCIDHYMKIYTLAELNKMVNPQGLPTKWYKGGTNCRHTLEAYVD